MGEAEGDALASFLQVVPEAAHDAEPPVAEQPSDILLEITPTVAEAWCLCNVFSVGG